MRVKDHGFETVSQGEGFSFLREVFSDSEIDSARRGQEALMEGKTNRQPSFEWDFVRARGERSCKIPLSTHLREELFALARSPRLLMGIARETGAKSIRLWFDQLLWEGPRPSKSGPLDYHWHTERSRWLTCDSPLMVTAWIPLSEVTLEMGPLTFVEKSAAQRWLRLPEGWEPKKENLVSAVLRVGDAALFCWHTVHGNPANLGPRPRRAIAIHYAINGLSYRPHGHFHHLMERLVRTRDGLPDFSYEKALPLLWRNSAR